MKETKFKQTEIGTIPEDWEVTKIRKRYERTLGEMDASVSEYEKRVNDHLKKLGFEV